MNLILIYTIVNTIVVINSEQCVKLVTGEEGDYELNINCKFKPLNINTNNCITNSSKDLRYVQYWNVLKSVTIINCQIQDIKYSFGNNYKTIENFSLTHTNLTKFVNFEEQMMLKRLNLSHNKLHVISPYNFYQNPKLKMLDLSYNEIKVLEADAFVGNYSLKFFFYKIINGCNNLFIIGLNMLLDLRLNNNPLIKFAANEFLPSLIMLDVAKTFISEFTFILNLKNLKKIKVCNISETNKQLTHLGRVIEIYSDEENENSIKTEYYTSISYTQQPNSNFNLTLYFIFTLFIFMCIFVYFFYLHLTQCLIKRQTKCIHSLVV